MSTTTAIVKHQTQIEKERQGAARKRFVKSAVRNCALGLLAGTVTVGAVKVAQRNGQAQD